MAKLICCVHTLLSQKFQCQSVQHMWVHEAYAKCRLRLIIILLMGHYCIILCNSSNPGAVAVKDFIIQSIYLSRLSDMGCYSVKCAVKQCLGVAHFHVFSYYVLRHNDGDRTKDGTPVVRTDNHTMHRMFREHVPQVPRLCNFLPGRCPNVLRDGLCI